MKKAVLALVLVLVMVSSAWSGVQAYSSGLPEPSSDSVDADTQASSDFAQSTAMALDDSIEFPKIHLKAGVFDPLAEPEPAFSGLKMGSKENGRYLLQLTGPTQEPWLHELEALGVTVLGYIPDYTYLVVMDADAIESVRSLPYFRWVGSYHPSYKIIPSLLGRTGLVEVNIDIFGKPEGNSGREAALSFIQENGGSITYKGEENFRLRAIVDASLVSEIAFLPQVEWIDEYITPHTFMDNIRVFTGSVEIEGIGYNGTGIVGGVRDNGFEREHLEFNPDGFEKIILDGDPPDGDHGTATYGILFSLGINETRSKGMLPNAQGVFASYEVGSRTSSVSNLINWEGVFQSNSWSSGSENSLYTGDSRENDQIVFDSDISLIWGVGNGGGERQIANDAVAKNVIGVGGVYHLNNDDRSDDAHTPVPGIRGGSQGPADDGRIKPDLCGPYDMVYTTDSHPDDDVVGYNPLGNYTERFTGTSASAPVVAGAVGALYEMYRANYFMNNLEGLDPPASTIKAILIADAYQYDFDQANRYQQGWGLVDIQNIYGIGPYRHIIVNESTPLSTGQKSDYTVVPSGASTPLKISLVWTDPPGTSSASKHLVNDLDLTVIGPDNKIYKGNNGLLEGKWSLPDGESDDINNVENVFIEDPPTGLPWRVEVYARNIAKDGTLHTTNVTDQAFSLVISGASRRINDLGIYLSIPDYREGGDRIPIDVMLANLGSLSKTYDYKTHVEVTNFDGEIIFKTDSNGINLTSGQIQRLHWDTPSLISDTYVVRVSILTKGGSAPYLDDVNANNEATDTLRFYHYVFKDNVETDANNWTASTSNPEPQIPDTPSLWHRTEAMAYSGDWSWHCGREILNRYTPLVNDHLVKKFEISDIASPDLMFVHHYDINTTQNFEDWGIVETSLDNETWETVGTYAGTTGNWSREIISLKTVPDGYPHFYLRFTLQPDIILTGGGWYVDDIMIGGRKVKHDLQLSAPVTSGDTNLTGNIKFNVNVTNGGNVRSQIFLELINTPSTWTISPLKTELSIKANVTSIVRVTASPNEDAKSGPYSFTAKAYVHMFDLNWSIQTIKFHINLNQSHLMEAFPTAFDLDLDPGEVFETNISIINNGNGNEIIDLKWCVISSDNSTIWAKSINWTSSPIGPWSEKMVQLTITAPPMGFSGDSVIITLYANSTLEPSLGNSSANVSIKAAINNFYSISTPPTPVPEQLYPGETVEYVIPYHNRGNKLLTVDFKVVAPMSGWDIDLSADSLVIPPFSRDNLTVSINTSLNSYVGLWNALTINATPREASELWTLLDIPVDIDTQGNIHLDGPGSSVSGSPGESLQFFLDATNTLNFDERVEISFVMDVPWPIQLYTNQGKPIFDTNGDGRLDIGPVPAFGGVTSFSASVRVPDSAPAFTANQITITIHSRTLMGLQASTSVSIYVGVTGNTLLQSGVTSKHGMPADNLTYYVSLVNGFNTADIVNLDIGGPDGWNARILDTDGLPLADSDEDGLPDGGILSPSGGRIEFMVRVTIPENALADTAKTFTLYAKSSASGMTVEKDLDVVVDANHAVRVESTSGASVFSVNPGAKKNITLSIVNEGNSQEISVVFFDSLLGWGMTVTDSNGIPLPDIDGDGIYNLTSLAPFSGIVNITIEITVPENSQTADREKITVNVREGVGTYLLATTSLQIEVTPSGTELVTVDVLEKMVMPGGDVSFKITVLNNHNYPETYDIQAEFPIGWYPSSISDLSKNPVGDTNFNLIPDTGAVAAQGGSSQALLTTRAPYKIEAGQKAYLTVSIYSSRGEVGSFGLTIHIGSTGDFTLATDKSSADSQPGRTSTFRLSVLNNQNYPDVLELETSQELNWNIRLRSDRPLVDTTLDGRIDTGTLKPYTSLDIFLDVTVPDSALGGASNSFTFDVKSTVTPGRSVTTSFSVSVSVVHKIKMLIEGGGFIDLTDNLAEVRVQITNLGNVPETPNVNIGGIDPAWITSPDVEIIQPGRTEILVFVITVPEGQTAGRNLTVSAEVQGQTSPIVHHAQVIVPDSDSDRVMLVLTTIAILVIVTIVILAWLRSKGPRKSQLQRMPEYVIYQQTQPPQHYVSGLSIPETPMPQTTPQAQGMSCSRCGGVTAVGPAEISKGYIQCGSCGAGGRIQA